jgi:hypothetical protein
MFFIDSVAHNLEIHIINGTQGAITHKAKTTQRREKS